MSPTDLDVRAKKNVTLIQRFPSLKILLTFGVNILWERRVWHNEGRICVTLNGRKVNGSI